MSLATSRSTASFPDCIRPEALMRGPILNTMSLIVIFLLFNPHTFNIPLKPMLGLELSRLRP